MQDMLSDKYSYVGRYECESLEKAIKILQDPPTAYPDLIKKGEDFIKLVRFELNSSTEHFSNQSYNDPLYGRHDGIGKHHQHIFWGLDALEKALRAYKRADRHFTQLGSRKILYDHQLFAQQLLRLKIQLNQSMAQAKGIPQHLIDEQLFVWRQEEFLANLQKRILDVEGMLSDLK
jgi:hypothetical protein